MELRKVDDCLEGKSTCFKSRVDLKKLPSSRIGQPREKQSDDLKTYNQIEESTKDSPLKVK